MYDVCLRNCSEATMKLDQKRPLSPHDTEWETLGCRHSNPDICRNHSTEGKCAFVREDERCLLVPRSWKKLFKELKTKRPDGV
jgi:hypothetical protein